ncbi:hypothetical protein GCM10027059_50430 [Myceligenerans halotolerans]
MTPEGSTELLFLGDQVAWHGDDLVVSDDELLARLDRPYLSASTAKAMHSCPARMVADRALPSSFDLFSPTEKGTAAHLVLERLYALRPQLRDRVHAAAILTDMARQEPPDEMAVDYAQALGADAVRYTRWIAAITRAYEGVFTIEDPAGVVVHATEMLLDGVEIGGIPFKGIIDRVDDVDGELGIVDYKTGRDRSRPNPRFGDDHGDQIKLYAAAVRELTGKKPKLGFLYYIEHGKKRRVSLADRAITKAVRGFRTSWEALQESVATRAFATHTSPLCGWCPLVNACPAAQRENMTDRKGGAPAAVVLGIPTIGPPTASAAHLTSDNAPDAEDIMSTTPWREAKPYDGAEIDGHLSLNSYAATAVFGLTTLAAEQLHAAGQKLGPATLRLTTGVLAKVVLDAQETVTHGSRDWQEGVNTRLRGALRTSLDLIPMPFGGDHEAWSEWGTRTRNFIVAVATTAIGLYDEGPALDIDALILATGGGVSDDGGQAAA